MNKKHFFLLNIDIYHMDIIVSYNQTDEEFYKSIKKYKIEDDVLNQMLNLRNSNRGRTLSAENGGIILRLKKQSTPIDFHSLIAHEVFHITTMIMDRIGDKLEIGVNADAYAYLIENLTRKILTKIK